LIVISMSRKRPRLEVEVGGGGLYDFLPKPAETEVVAVTQSLEHKPLPKEDKTKVIFLDIDGVLKPEGETERVLVDGDFVPVLPKVEDISWNKVALRALRTIVLHTGASIVLSSEWRRTEIMRNAIGVTFRSHGLPQIRACTTTTLKPKRELLKANNTIAFAERRAREIGTWLQQNPDVATWVCLDDVDLSWGDGARTKGIPLMRSRVVKTNKETCLNEKDALLAIDILCNQPILTPEQEAGAERRATRKLQSAYPHLKEPNAGADDREGRAKPIPRRQGF